MNISCQTTFRWLNLRRVHRFGWLLAIVVCVAGTYSESSRAEPVKEFGGVPNLRPRVENPLEGKAIVQVQLSFTSAWTVPGMTPSLKVGEAFSEARIREATRSLFEQKGVADVEVRTKESGGGVAVEFRVLVHRIIEEVRINSNLDVRDALRAAGVETGRAVTLPMLEKARKSLEEVALQRGYPQSIVSLTGRDTDDPKATLVLVELKSGNPLRIEHVKVEVETYLLSKKLRLWLEGYKVHRKDPANDDECKRADRVLEDKLRAEGYHRATVKHKLLYQLNKAYLVVNVKTGPLIRIRYEGNLVLGAEQLDSILDLEKESDRSSSRIAVKLRDEYRRLGFHDVRITIENRGKPTDAVHDMIVKIAENLPVRVVSRTYPCLTGERKPSDIGSEIDSFLEEDLPGTTFLSSVSPAAVDSLLGPKGNTGARADPLPLSPRSVFAPDTYDRALKHVQNLYRAEGYLNAMVGPIQVVRRTCDPKSPPNKCIPLPLSRKITDKCLVDSQNLPVEEQPLAPDLLCKPNPKKGIECEPTLWIRIPVKLGPKAILYDISFEGAQTISQKKLMEISGLTLGEPASNAKIDDARRAILDEYRNQGFAFAEVQNKVELSPNKLRARASFSILERQRVKVQKIIIRGNQTTEEGVIRTRLRFREGDWYGLEQVRRSEELIATLGVFSTVSIELEDPAIPATHKNVIITVAERASQFLELRWGMSSGEGFRTLLEYGHRNLMGKAIAFNLNVRLSYLPDLFIPDESVRKNYDELTLGERLARRISVGLIFPNVFSPNFRLAIDLVDVRYNARDFGLTKRAVLPVLVWQPHRQIRITTGASVELNDVTLFSGDTLEGFLLQPGVTNDLRRLLRVPQGETIAISQRGAFAWDRRDSPLGATQGTLLAGSAEHVNAVPTGESNQSTTKSDFIRFAGTMAGYLRFTKKGLALAVALSGGYNQQLNATSKTYPDRLFFIGGIDTIRGFSRDSLVPQDIADQITSDAANTSLSSDSKLTIDKVAVRGGDVFLNPRVELRIPLSGPVKTALFVDAGNVWVDPKRIDPFRLRYAGGSGIRIDTPIGPIALDYGVNLLRRSWEDFGAFHFSIGLF
jgi:outer membrane protein insertion porin family